MNQSPIYRMPLKITGYQCRVCGTGHRIGTKIFFKHFSNNFDEWGQWIPLPKEPKELHRED